MPQPCELFLKCITRSYVSHLCNTFLADHILTNESTMWTYASFHSLSLCSCFQTCAPHRGLHTQPLLIQHMQHTLNPSVKCIFPEPLTLKFTCISFLDHWHRRMGHVVYCSNQSQILVGSASQIFWNASWLLLMVEQEFVSSGHFITMIRSSIPRRADTKQEPV